jgi:hypothetical protein
LYAPNGNLKHTEPFEVDKDAVKQWQRFFFSRVERRGCCVALTWQDISSEVSLTLIMSVTSQNSLLAHTETAVKPEIDSHNIATLQRKNKLKGTLSLRSPTNIATVIAFWE